MCTTRLAPQVTQFEAANSHRGSNFRRAEDTADRKMPLGMNWVVVVDEHGNGRLQMHWTVARVFPPSPAGRAAWPRFEPVTGRVGNLTPGPQAQAMTL